MNTYIFRGKESDTDRERAREKLMCIEYRGREREIDRQADRERERDVH